MTMPIIFNAKVSQVSRLPIRLAEYLWNFLRQRRWLISISGRNSPTGARVQSSALMQLRQRESRANLADTFPNPELLRVIREGKGLAMSAIRREAPFLRRYASVQHRFAVSLYGGASLWHRHRWVVPTLDPQRGT